MKKHTIAKRIISLIIIMCIGSTAMVSATSTISSDNYGFSIIEQIKSRNNSGNHFSTIELINRIINRNKVTQNPINIKNNDDQKEINVKNNTTMIASDARYFNIYDSTDDDKQVLDTLIAYEKVNIKEAVGNYYKIDKGYIDKRAVLTEDEFNQFNDRDGELNYEPTECSNVSLNKLQYMLKDYPKVKGLELTILICEKEYKVNAIFLCAVAILESNMGESNIAVKKNNWFGIRAYDWDPYKKALAYDSPAECINSWCRLINNGYFDHDLTNINSIGRKYCSSKSWANSVISISKRLIRSIDN